MRSRFALFTMVLTAAMALSACGDDNPTGVQGDPLTQAEVQAVFTALSGAFSSVGSPSASPAMDGVPQPSAAPVDVDQIFDFSAPCPVDGTLAAAGSVSGTVDNETFSSDLRYQLAITPSGCAVTSEQQTTVVVDGDPSVVITMDAEFSETTFAVDGSYTGGLAYTTSDGREGSCGINLTFSISSTGSGGGQQSVSGRVCGISGSHFQAYNPS